MLENFKKRGGTWDSDNSCGARSQRYCLLKNKRQKICAKIRVMVTVYRQLWIPDLLFSRSLKIGVNIALFWLQNQLLNLANKAELRKNPRKTLWYRVSDRQTRTDTRFYFTSFVLVISYYIILLPKITRGHAFAYNIVHVYVGVKIHKHVCTQKLCW